MPMLPDVSMAPSPWLTGRNTPRHQFVAEPRHRVPGAGALAHHHEFVAAQPVDQPVRATPPRPEPFGQRPEHRIARGMAHGVVDELEPVEIEQQQRQAGISTGKSARDVVGQRAAIAQTGQAVVIGRLPQTPGLVSAAS